MDGAVRSEASCPPTYCRARSMRAPTSATGARASTRPPAAARRVEDRPACRVLRASRRVADRALARIVRVRPGPELRQTRAARAPRGAAGHHRPAAPRRDPVGDLPAVVLEVPLDVFLEGEAREVGSDGDPSRLCGVHLDRLVSVLKFGGCFEGSEVGMCAKEIAASCPQADMRGRFGFHGRVVRLASPAKVGVIALSCGQPASTAAINLCPVG